MQIAGFFLLVGSTLGCETGEIVPLAGEFPNAIMSPY